MGRLWGLWVGLLLAGLVPLGFTETLGPDGFPVTWTAGDFAVGASDTAPPTGERLAAEPSEKLTRPVEQTNLEGATQGVEPYSIPMPARAVSSTQRGHKMVQMRVDQMKTVTLPGAYGVTSATTIALPPLVASGSAVVSGSAFPSATVVPVVKVPKPSRAPLQSLWRREDDWAIALPRTVARGVASPALKEALRRVLTVPAVSPDGLDGTQWVTIRAQSLEKLGLYEAAWGLWDSVGAPSSTTPLPPVSTYGWAQARVLAGDAKTPCELARTAAATTAPNSDAPWPVMVTVCQLLEPAAEGNVAGAGLSLQLIEPTLKATNPALLRVLYAVQDGKPVGLQTGGALGGAVLAAYPALIGSGTLAKLPDMALRRLAATPALPANLTAAAAVALAAQTGALADGEAAWRRVSATVPGSLPDNVLVAGAAALSPSLVAPAALRMGDVSTAVAMLGGASPTLRLMVRARAGTATDIDWATWQAALPPDTPKATQDAMRLALGLNALKVPVPPTVWTVLQGRTASSFSGANPVWQHALQGAVANQDGPKVLALIVDAAAGRPVAEMAPGALESSVLALVNLGQTELAWRLVAEAVLPPPFVRLNVKALPMPLAPMEGISDTAPAPKRAVQAVAKLPLAEPNGMLPPPRVAAPTKPTVAAPVHP